MSKLRKTQDPGKVRSLDGLEIARLLYAPQRYRSCRDADGSRARGRPASNSSSRPTALLVRAPKKQSYGRRCRMNANVRITPAPFGGFVAITPYRPDYVERLKATVPPAGRRWLPEQRAWWISAAWIAPVRRILDEHFGGEHFASGDGATRDFEPDVRPSLDLAYSALHLLPSAPPVLVKAAYRTLSKLHHPDRGGSLGAMQRVNKAYDDLRRRMPA